jgi:hypothetical protein
LINEKFTILFFGGFSISLTAQNKDTKIADKLFGQFEYVQATEGISVVS